VVVKLPVLAAHWGYIFFCVALELKEKNMSFQRRLQGFDPAPDYVQFVVEGLTLG
jgi:hypothetical protein